MGTSTRHRYGAGPSHVGELHLPPGQPSEPLPVVVVVHGGFWRDRYDLSLGTPLAADLAAHGLAAWNIEYRRVGDGPGGGGGWPSTMEDVAAAVDHLAVLDAALGHALDLARVVALGHSAGGHLALRVAGRRDPVVRVRGAVSQAGVLDLVEASRARLGDGAVDAFLGGPPDRVPARYETASPAARVPIGVPVRCVHGRSDDVVPPEQSRRYVAAATAAGDDAALVEVDGDHFAVIDPRSPAWATCRRTVQDLLGQR